jgi:hypothetical protein
MKKAKKKSGVNTDCIQDEQLSADNVTLVDLYNSWHEWTAANLGKDKTIEAWEATLASWERVEFEKIKYDFSAFRKPKVVKKKSGVYPDWIQAEEDRDEILKNIDNQKKIELKTQQNIKIDDYQRLKKITRRFIILSEESLPSSRSRDFKLTDHFNSDPLCIKFKVGNFPYIKHYIQFNVTNNKDIGEIVYRVTRASGRYNHQFRDYSRQEIRKHTVNFSISKMSQITDGEIYELFRICIHENYFLYIKMKKLFKKYI